MLVCFPSTWNRCEVLNDLVLIQSTTPRARNTQNWFLVGGTGLWLWPADPEHSQNSSKSLQNSQKSKDPPATWPPRLGRHYTDVLWTISRHLRIAFVSLISECCDRCEVSDDIYLIPELRNRVPGMQQMTDVGGTVLQISFPLKSPFNTLPNDLHFKGGVWGG